MTIATLKHLTTARRLRTTYWSRACAYDQIPETMSFVVFSDGNPYTALYNRAARVWGAYFDKVKAMQCLYANQIYG